MTQRIRRRTPARAALLTAGLAAVLVVIVLSYGPGAMPQPPQPPAVSAAEPRLLTAAPVRRQPATRRRAVQSGLASFYARTFNGQLTASGIPFDNDAMVAAHPTYPFGTILRVTNLRNRRSVEVRVVDRGPARGPRARGVIIDLSRAAADALGFVRRGRTRVRLEVIGAGTAPAVNR